MPTVVFEGNAIGREKRVEAQGGGMLADLADEVLAPIAFSCRSATCATCQIEVVAGVELLEPPAAEEHELLQVLRSPPGVRLACQAQVKAGAGTLVVKPVGT